MGATIIVLLLIALIPASIASKKGKSFGLWYVYGVCLWIVALIHSLVLPDESQNQNNNSANNSYKPYEPITKTEPVINTVKSGIYIGYLYSSSNDNIQIMDFQKFDGIMKIKNQKNQDIESINLNFTSD